MKIPPVFGFLALTLAALLPHDADAATLLFSHQGAVNPTTQGWTYSGNAETIGVTNDLGTGVDAWRVFEQGGGVAHSGTYNKTLTNTQLADALVTGWTMDAKIRYAAPDPLVALPLNNNAWCTFLVDEGVAGKRDLYGLYFGNDAQGNTLVRLYTAGPTYTVSPGYHDYKISWDPLTQLASFYIDGELKASDYAGTTIDNVGTTRVYWGDNTTTAVNEGRGAHYAYVGFSTGTASIPEPSRSLLLVVAMGTVCLRRRR